MKNNSVALISRIREGSNKFIAEKLEENGISGLVPSHGDIMYTLYSCEKCTMQELAKKIHRTKATLTVLVDKLIALGFVSKDSSPKDSRVKYIKLTQKGKDTKPIFEKISNELNSKFHSGFSREEIENLNLLLKKARENMS